MNNKIYCRDKERFINELEFMRNKYWQNSVRFFAGHDKHGWWIKLQLV